MRVFPVMIGAAFTGGALRLWGVDKLPELTEPLPTRLKKKAVEVIEVPDEDSHSSGVDSSVASVLGSVDSKVDSPSEESTGCKKAIWYEREFTSSEESGEEPKKPEKPKEPEKPEKPVDVVDGDSDDGVVAPKLKRPPLWQATHYYIADNSHTTKQDLKIRIHDCYCTDGQLGKKNKSRTLTPSHYGETRADPERTMILLRAWALWRCAGPPGVTQSPHRVREFAVEADRVERLRARLQATDKLLGDDKASGLFRSWVPEIASRLEAA